nr:LysR family transcriptional regulator [Streptomyces sp. RPT161]
MREVAEHGSLTAAELLYPQSASTRRISTREQAAGVKLFGRRPCGVSLTATGQALLRHAVWHWTPSPRPNGNCEGSPERHVARLGTFPSAGALLLPRALTALRSICQVTVRWPPLKQR